MTTLTIQQKVKSVVGKIKGIPAKEVSIKDSFENLEFDGFDMDEMVEVLSDYYDIDLGVEFDYTRHTHVGHVVKLVEKLSNW
jgi:hypothetical protein